jgi:hypothetical protein
MGKGEVATIFDLTRQGQSFVDARQRAVRAQRLRLESRQQDGVEPRTDPCALAQPLRQRPAMSAAAAAAS